jgi:hypothetical protein
MLTLYLKEHNKTGLKYLGKTVKDAHTYSGSGIRWKAHLKKHGKDISTTILFQCEDKKEFKKVALEYSHKWNIVESHWFANLMNEEGQGGMTGNQWKKGHTTWNKGLKVGPTGPQTEEHKEKRESTMRKEIIIDGTTYSCTKEASAAVGIPISTLNYYGKIHGRENVSLKEYKKYPNRANNIGSINKIAIECPHCGKTANAGNMQRWHYDNCKKKRRI